MKVLRQNNKIRNYFITDSSLVTTWRKPLTASNICCDKFTGKLITQDSSAICVTSGGYNSSRCKHLMHNALRNIVTSDEFK